MATNEHREKLSGLPLLKGLPEDAKARICAVIEGVSEETTAASGEDLLQEGHLAFASGYILLEGTVLVERQGREPIDRSIRAVHVKARGEAQRPRVVSRLIILLQSRQRGAGAGARARPI